METYRYDVRNRPITREQGEVVLVADDQVTRSVADPGGGFRVVNPLKGFFFACQYMKIPADIHPNPPPPL